MTDQAITFMLEKLQDAEPWVRPFSMDALIRNGSDRGEVIEAFDPSADEIAKLDELLAQERAA